MVKYISALVIVLTFVFFVLALFTKGLTHDLLLEAGVFLVSAKLIIMAYKIDKTETEIKKILISLNQNIADLGDRCDMEKSEVYSCREAENRWQQLVSDIERK